MLNGMQRSMRGSLTDVQRRQRLPSLRALHAAPHQLVNAFPFTGANGNHRDTKLFFQNIQLDNVPVGAHLIHHVQRHDHGRAQLAQLHGQIKIALQVGGVHDIDDHIRLIQRNKVTGDNLLHGKGTQRVDAGEVDDFHVAVVRLAQRLFPLE